MYKNIISDFGKVLVRFESDIMTAPWVSDENDRRLVGEVVFARAYWDKLDSGDITYKEIEKDYRERLPERLWDAADKTLENWLYYLPPIEGMRELYEELRSKGARLYLLSNISIEFAENFRSIPETGDFLASFDGLVFSGPLRITKPRKEIFEHLLNKYDLKAEDCIFIDDSPVNVAGAEVAGIKAYLFDDDVTKLREFLLK